MSELGRDIFLPIAISIGSSSRLCFGDVAVTNKEVDCKHTVLVENIPRGLFLGSRVFNEFESVG
jgi:hypothetical protein